MISREDAKQSAQETDAAEAVHVVKVTTVRRRDHDIARLVVVIRCNAPTCTFRQEHSDGERATSEALRHEACVDARGRVVAEVSGE